MSPEAPMCTKLGHLNLAKRHHPHSSRLTPTRAHPAAVIGVTAAVHSGTLALQHL